MNVALKSLEHQSSGGLPNLRRWERSGDEQKKIEINHHIEVHSFSQPYARTKRCFDMIFSVAILLALVPFLIVVALLIKLTSKGPVFFSQTRVGVGGRHFKMFKFRTMVTNAEELKCQLMSSNEQNGPVFKIKKDPRITKIGGFLRKYSIDELPQFINVLMGDMSVVGPRPPVPSEVSQYLSWQTRRLSVKPGLTCIWQVSGRSHVDFSEWVRMDIRYIESASSRTDVLLVAKTVSAVIRAQGAY